MNLSENLNKKTGASFLLSEAKANTAELALEEIENEKYIAPHLYYDDLSGRVR
jgi:hypothetical protein